MTRHLQSSPVHDGFPISGPASAEIIADQHDVLFPRNTARPELVDNSLDQASGQRHSYSKRQIKDIEESLQEEFGPPRLVVEAEVNYLATVALAAASSEDEEREDAYGALGGGIAEPYPVIINAGPHSLLGSTVEKVGGSKTCVFKELDIQSIAQKDPDSLTSAERAYLTIDTDATTDRERLEIGRDLINGMATPTRGIKPNDPRYAARQEEFYAAYGYRWVYKRTRSRELAEMPV